MLPCSLSTCVYCREKKGDFGALKFCIKNTHTHTHKEIEREETYCYYFTWISGDCAYRGDKIGTTNIKHHFVVTVNEDVIPNRLM